MGFVTEKQVQNPLNLMLLLALLTLRSYLTISEPLFNYEVGVIISLLQVLKECVI